MKKSTKNVIIGMLISIIIIGMSVAVIQKKKVEREERINNRIIELGLDLKSINEEIKRRHEVTLKVNENITTAVQEIVDYIETDKYAEEKYIRGIKNKYGIEADSYRIYTMEISFYSDLNCENGYGNLTATGEILSPGFVANNHLPFGTEVYLEGYGKKVVKDRGSHRYFNAVNKFDVFVPRNSGESDSQYYKRVNNMGRLKVKGIIFE